MTLVMYVDRKLVFSRLGWNSRYDNREEMELAPTRRSSEKKVQLVSQFIANIDIRVRVG